jgi:hypothetical protein
VLYITNGSAAAGVGAKDNKRERSKVEKEEQKLRTGHTSRGAAAEKVIVLLSRSRA